MAASWQRRKWARITTLPYFAKITSRRRTTITAWSIGSAVARFRYYKGEMFFAWRDANAPDGSEQGLKLNTLRSYAAGVVGGFLCTVAIAPCPRHLPTPPRARCRSRAHAAL